MKVKTLIKMLEHRDPEAEVVVYSEAYHDCSYLGAAQVVGDCTAYLAELPEPVKAVYIAQKGDGP